MLAEQQDRTVIYMALADSQAFIVLPDANPRPFTDEDLKTLWCAKGLGADPLLIVDSIVPAALPKPFVTLLISSPGRLVLSDNKAKLKRYKTPFLNMPIPSETELRAMREAVFPSRIA